MLGYLTIGANDIVRSERFYTAVLGPLDYRKALEEDGVAYTLPDSADGSNGLTALYVKKPFDGWQATVGNGSMMAFRAPTPDQVRALHSAGLAEDLILFVRQNNGALSCTRRTGEFLKLRDDEVTLLEGIVRDSFEGFDI